MNIQTTLPNHISLSHSSFTAYKTCPRLFFNKYILNLYPKTLNTDIIFGSTVHKMLEVYYNTHSVKSAIESGTTEWNSYFDNADKNDIVISGKKFKTHNTAIELFLYYINDVSKETKDNFITVKSEFKLEVDLTDRISLLVVIDGIWSIQGTNYIIEHKTTSWIAAKLLESQKHSYQPYTYLLALDIDKSNIWDVDNVLVNVLSYSAREKKDESFGVPTIDCTRGVITGNEKLLVNTHTQYVDCGTDILKSLHIHNYLQDFSNCINKFNRKCDYFDLCWYNFGHDLHEIEPHRDIFKEKIKNE
ncbi:MAG: PD-(D/E)XK nuclease family protein [bacterium]|nr:PD-(D/E)XK nuclease family protein [bacterium]